MSRSRPRLRLKGEDANDENRIASDMTTDSNDITATEATTTSADGTTIAYDRRGAGPAVILVGGAFQYRAFDPRTAQLADLLAPHFTVVHYDRRGRGGSGDTAPYATEREIEDLAALIREVGGSAAVFGHSSGAVLALDAVAAGLPITKLAVYEAPFVVDDSRSLPADYREHLAALVAEDRRGDTVAYFMTAAVGVPPEVVAGMRQAPMWPGFEAVAHTLPYDAAFMEGTLDSRPLPKDRWASVTIPVFIGDGGASPQQMHAAAAALAELLPDVRRETFEGQDHGVDPAVLAPALIEFFG
jgi:pimeloyl-ACP methyl ester carboxylesterase